MNVWREHDPKWRSLNSDPASVVPYLYPVYYCPEPPEDVIEECKVQCAVGSMMYRCADVSFYYCFDNKDETMLINAPSFRYKINMFVMMPPDPPLFNVKLILCTKDIIDDYCRTLSQELSPLESVRWSTPVKLHWKNTNWLIASTVKDDVKFDKELSFVCELA